ncbi:MAG TPA: ATP phosphoribosyltransferase regulatory subunit [Myxococcales bacterium]|nr:ATP phosphoribosyltransferase regulatory subunit [Myxococcales bacterium]
MEPAVPLPGTQDLLFEAARSLRRCEQALAAVFEQAGYAEVIPPAIEGAEIFGVEAFRALDKSGKLVALRSDFTAQVARIAATRLAGVSPLRLWYRGSVVRRDREQIDERVQAGCEYVGAPGADADAEIIRLAAGSLRALGLNDARISLGSTGYFEALARAAGVSDRLAQALHGAIDRKDLPTLRALCEKEVAKGLARDALLILAQPPRPKEQAEDLLARARSVAPGDDALAALQRLTDVLVRCRDVEGLEVDLGEVRGLGYYTGVVFNLYAAGAPQPVGGGGRYDTLLGRFGDPRPAVGFSLNLDALVPLAC